MLKLASYEIIYRMGFMKHLCLRHKTRTIYFANTSNANRTKFQMYQKKKRLRSVKTCKMANKTN